MYYLVSLIIYICIIVFFFIIRSKIDREKSSKYRKDFIEFAKEEISGSGNKRKNNIKNLSGKEKFILYMGMFSIFFGFAVFVALYLIIRKYVIIKPSDVIFFEYVLSFSFLGCFASVVSSVVLSVPLKRLIDRKDVMENVTGEPKTTFKQDLYIISILLLICFPIIVFCMNTYRYVSVDGLHNKGIFSFKEDFYSFEEFDHVEKHLYQNGHDYNVVLKSGKKMKLYDEVYISEEEKLINILMDNNISIKEE